MNENYKALRQSYALIFQSTFTFVYLQSCVNRYEKLARSTNLLSVSYLAERFTAASSQTCTQQLNSEVNKNLNKQNKTSLTKFWLKSYLENIDRFGMCLIAYWSLNKYLNRSWLAISRLKGKIFCPKLLKLSLTDLGLVVLSLPL